MYRKDKIRLGLSITLLGVIFTTYFLTDSKEIAGYSALISLAVWLGAIYFFRKEN